MNIYQKLIEVRKSCEYLKKDNQGFQFKFVSSAQTLGTLRGAMDEHGLLLVPSVISNEVRDHTTKKGNHEYFTILEMSFRWVNAEKPEEFIDCPWVGQGLDDGEKGVGKALTYAEKYFLLKFFNIATDKDDPDANQGKKGTDTPPPQNKTTQTKPAAPAYKVKQLKEALLEYCLGNQEDAACKLKEITTFPTDSGDRWMDWDKAELQSDKWVTKTLKDVLKLTDSPM